MKVNLCFGKFEAAFKDYIVAKSFSNILIVSDETVWNIYSDKIRSVSDLKSQPVFLLPAGESSKTLENTRKLWTFFIENKVDKASLIIAFGGGSVSDAVGFAASTFKRGVETLYLPTTLLAQVDASIGGKTAINLSDIKNVVGTFSFPAIVISDAEFLKSLPSEEIENGIAEMLKHSLLCSEEYLKELKSLDSAEEFLNEDLILRSASFKTEVVEADPFDRSDRRQLNLGHTIGHAIESLMLQKNKSISHGAAVAAGLEMEIYLSYKYFGLDRSVYEDVLSITRKYFSKLLVDEEDSESITGLMSQDKKSLHNEILMVALLEIAQHEIRPVSAIQIREALHVYLSL